MAFSGCFAFIIIIPGSLRRSPIEFEEYPMREEKTEELADWFAFQSARPELPFPERLMLENVSHWLRSQQTGETKRPVASIDPWIGVSQ
jgi:hypothetical protein